MATRGLLCRAPRRPTRMALTVVLTAAAGIFSWAALESRCNGGNWNGSCNKSEVLKESGQAISADLMALASPEPAQADHRQQIEGESVGPVMLSVLFGLCAFMVTWIAATLKWAIDGSLPARLALWGLLPEAYAVITVSAAVNLMRLKSGATPVVMLRNCVTEGSALQLAEGIKLYGKKADLQSLELPYNHQMSAAGIRAIVDVVCQEDLALEEFDFSYNPHLGEAVLEAVQPLLEKKGSSLNTLRLADCNLRSSVLSVLSKSAPKLRLQTVDLSGNPLARAGEAIAELLEAPVLEELFLACCGLELSDVQQIAEQLPYASLRSLHLAGNDIRRTGLQALADNLASCRIEDLGLEGNQLQAADLSCLGEAWVKRPFARLRLSGNLMTQGEIANFVQTLRSIQ